MKHPVRMAAAASLTWAALASPALGAEATTIGERYADGLDSRLAAQRLADAARGVGYTATAHTSGRSAADAWDDGLDAAVFGVFGHANAGLAQTDEGAGGAPSQYLVAGFPGDTGGSNVALWSDYLPFLDVDWMKLAVFAGCDTALSSEWEGSWLDRARELGVDSVLAFRQLVFYPASCTTNCDYSGNYLWGRFSTYARAGDPVRTAISKAVADLTAKEGSGDGWESYVVGGSVANPGAVRITPAGDGQALTSKPLGIDPFDPLALTVTERRALTVEGQPVEDRATAEGVAYRLDADGDLIWLQAPASTRGTSELDDAAVRAAALRFLDEHVAAFDAGAQALTGTEAVAHAEGERLQRLTWRRMTGDVPAAERVTVEVDRRTGAVTFLSVARAGERLAGAPIAREAAIAAARTAADDAGTVQDARLDVWDRARWTVTFARDGGRVPAVKKVTVDASTGDVVAVRST